MFNYFFNLIKNNNLFKYSAIFFTGSMLANFGNYFWNFLMARMLSVSDYGELQSLLSLLTILGIPAVVISTAIIKYSSKYKGEERLDKVYDLFKRFTEWLFIFSVLTFLVIASVSGFLVNFLKLTSLWPIFIIALVIIFSTLLIPSRSVLQGLQKFKALAVLSNIEIFLKITFAALLVFLGFGVNGAVLSIMISTLLIYFFTLLPIKFIFKYKSNKTKIEVKEIFKYFLPIFLTYLCLIFTYTLDVILVKHYFSPELAGQYGGLAIIGRTLVFVSGSIVAVMFSLSSEASDKNLALSENILKQSLVLVGGISLAILAFYFLFPGLVVRILLGGKFLVISGYIGWFSVAMVFYALINLLAQYFLSIHRSRFVYVMILGVVLEAVLIVFWHASITQIIVNMNIAMGLVLILLLLYYFMTSQNKKTLLDSKSQYVDR